MPSHVSLSHPDLPTSSTGSWLGRLACLLYLEGHGDVARRFEMRITRVAIRLIWDQARLMIF